VFENYLAVALLRILVNVSARLFNNTVDVMSSAQYFGHKREQLRQTLPISFRTVFNDCVCMINFIEKPSDLRARA